MSLINDALKKAQRQRLEESAPPVPEVPGIVPAETTDGRVAKRKKPADFRSQMLLLTGGGLALLCAVALAGFFLLRPHRKEAPATKPPAPAAHSPSVAPPIAPTAQSEATPPAPGNALAPNLPALVSAPPTPNPPAAAATATPPALTRPEPARAAEALKPVEKPQPSPRMIAIVEALKVAGIRAAGAESKVLMNDRVYRLNDIVEHELNIKLTGVTPTSLTFEDGRGAVYTRNF